MRPQSQGKKLTIEINNETDFEVDEARVLRLAEFALRSLKIHPASELAVIFVDEPAMEQLHIQWMDEPGPTDVLSFPMDELRPGNESEPSQAGLLGDIVICPTVAGKQAEAAGHQTINEILLLCTHGILHLLGFDHAEPDEEAEMFGLQREILAGFYQQEEAIGD
jgi:probable rRNA maturation factor